MNFDELLVKRRSVRRYKDQHVNLEDLKELINISAHAPSAGNMQPWKFIIINDKNGCGITEPIPFVVFAYPKFFTPNNDGVNDTFKLAGIEYYGTSSVSIFNRYGKLLKNTVNSPFEWDGTYVGEGLPTDDYWYVIIIDGQTFTGHFTLKR